MAADRIWYKQNLKIEIGVTSGVERIPLKELCYFGNKKGLNIIRICYSFQFELL